MAEAGRAAAAQRSKSDTAGRGIRVRGGAGRDGVQVAGREGVGRGVCRRSGGRMRGLASQGAHESPTPSPHLAHVSLYLALSPPLHTSSPHLPPFT